LYSGLAVQGNPGGTDGIIEKAKMGGQKQQEGDPKDDVKIVLWANGFQIEDDGEFREYEAPENKAFMKDLNDGKLPRELAVKYKRDIGIAISDKRKEKYRAPTPPKYISFSGEGQSLGGVSQAIGGAVDTSATGGKPAVDGSKPKTTIQFRFHNGTRATCDFNESHTVADLHGYIMSVAPVDGEYQLVSGFPPKPLTDVSATLKDAGLLKAAITQRLV